MSYCIFKLTVNKVFDSIQKFISSTLHFSRLYPHFIHPLHTIIRRNIAYTQNYIAKYKKNALQLLKKKICLQGAKASPRSTNLFWSEIQTIIRMLVPLLQTTSPPPPYMAIPLYIFSINPKLLARLFRQYFPNEIMDKHKNKLMRQNYFFIFRRLKNNIKCFFINSTFKSNTKLRFNLK